jgi:predicted RNA binding protein YcfA (HicA-like mRNA interferase family)
MKSEIKPKEAIMRVKAFKRAVKAAGGVWDAKGGKGSHAKVRFAGGSLTVPTHGKAAKDVPFYVLKQAKAFGVDC